MKKVLFLVLAMFVSAPVFAQESSLSDKIKAVVDQLEPSAEYGMFWSRGDIKSGNFTNGEEFAGFSGALYKFTKDEQVLGSFRLGGAFHTDPKAYMTLQANLITLTKVYAPEGFKAFMSPGFMGDVWNFVEDYGAIGVGPGLDNLDANFDLREDIGVVGTLGVSYRKEF